MPEEPRALRRVLRMIAVTIETISYASLANLATSANRSDATRLTYAQSHPAFAAFQSRRLSAARASSSIADVDVLQFTSCGTIIRPTPLEFPSESWP